MELVKTCDVVLYDRLVSQKIISQIPARAEKVYVGRNVGDPTEHQDRTNRLMVRYAMQGKTVLRLKGGDPFIFGRGAEEAEYLLERGIGFEVVPGITSAIASPAYAGIPLTHRKHSSSVAIVTGHEETDTGSRSVRWKKLATAVDTIVVLMGVGQLDTICEQLLKGGMKRTTKVAVIENGTTERQRSVSGTLATIAGVTRTAEIRPPAVVIIGSVAGLGDRLAWFLQK
jgi:uroporphyrin-III C-methyltransferase